MTNSVSPPSASLSNPAGRSHRQEGKITCEGRVSESVYMQGEGCTTHSYDSLRFFPFFSLLKTFMAKQNLQIKIYLTIHILKCLYLSSHSSLVVGTF